MNMKISMINGSPKVNTSCSGLLLEQIKKDILEQRKDVFSPEDFNIYRMNINPLGDADIAEIVKSDIIVVAFPLYVDGIPSHMLSALYQLEEAFVKIPDAPKPTFYGIVKEPVSHLVRYLH